MIRNLRYHHENKLQSFPRPVLFPILAVERFRVPPKPGVQAVVRLLPREVRYEWSQQCGLSHCTGFLFSACAAGPNLKTTARTSYENKRIARRVIFSNISQAPSNFREFAPTFRGQVGRIPSAAASRSAGSVKRVIRAALGWIDLSGRRGRATTDPIGPRRSRCRPGKRVLPEAEPAFREGQRPRGARSPRHCAAAARSRARDK